ncbi:MAG TPA: tetratricopeptide repeat protein, partial [Nannocystis sp.]
DREVVQRAAAIVAGLPDLRECADADRLMRGERRSLAERDEIAKLERMLAHAVAQRHAARFAPAQTLAERALHEARALKVPAIEAEALILLGQIAADQGRFDQAAESHLRAIAAAELGGVDEARALATTELGVVLGALQERHAEGERLLRLAAAIDQRVRASPIQQARRDMFLGILLGKRGALDDARQKLLSAVEALKGAPAAAGLSLISAYNALGSLEDESGRPERARAYFGDALALAEDRLGADHPDVATVLNNIGVLEDRQGRYEAALAAHERALAIRVRTLGPDHPEIASARMNLAVALQHAGEIERAIAHFEATATALRRSPELQGRLAETLYNLALCHFQREDFARAVPLFEEAMARAQAVGGPDDKVAAAALQGLAVSLVELDRLEEAQPLLDRALRIQTARGITPYDLAEIRFALARVQFGRDRQRALELASAARGDFARGGEIEMVARVDAWLQAHVQR